MVYPTKPDVTIRREPRFDDHSLLQKPCAKIAPAGEKMRVITGRTPEWVIVLKGDCWGWLKAHDVKIGETVALPA